MILKQSDVVWTLPRYRGGVVLQWQRLRISNCNVRRCMEFK